MASKVYEMVTNKILEAMANNNTVPWHKPWISSAPKNLSGREYRGINLLLLSFLPYKDNRFLTYKQAQEKGGTVKKGEHGHLVVFWKFIEAEDKDGKKKQIPFLRYYTVFNVEQCENLNIPPMSEQQIEFKPIEAAAEIGKEWGNQPSISHGGGMACYFPTLDSINLPQPEMFDSVEEYYSTKYHEMVHATGHWHRLNRFSVMDVLVHESYSKEELVAEIGASFLRAEAGIDSDKIMNNSAAYVKGWMKKLADDPTLIVSAASKAQKAVDMIMGRLRKEEAEEPEEEGTATEPKELVAA